MTSPADAQATAAPVSTATLTNLLDKRGYTNQAMRGVCVIGGRVQFTAEAHTARLLPFRKGLSSELATPSMRGLLAAVPAGHVLVVDGRGEHSGALIGDLMATWLVGRGVVGLVTDGAVRDAAALGDLDLAVFAGGVTPNPGSSRFNIGGVQQPIACGGVTVLPGDVLVGDRDGVVVLPHGEAEELLALGREQEEFEEYVALRLQAGEQPDGLYPPDATHRRQYEKWRSSRGGAPGTHPGMEQR